MTFFTTGAFRLLVPSSCGLCGRRWSGTSAQCANAKYLQ